MMRRAGATMVLCAVLACNRGPPAPAPLDTRNDACASCRMLVSDPRTAAQLVAPGEEPFFFDDVGCLARYLSTHSPSEGAVAYVADHRTRAWVPAASATYTLQPSAFTPMGSHVLAHLDAISRDADPSAKGGRPLSQQDLFGTAHPPEGR